MVQKLRQQWDCLTFQPGEDVDDFALCLSGLVQQLAYHDDGVINEPKVVEMYLLIVPKKYTQIALSLENLLDPSTLSIEEVMGWLKAVDDRVEAPPTNLIFVNGELLFTEE
jgi:hypothetical protein